MKRRHQMSYGMIFFVVIITLLILVYFIYQYLFNRLARIVIYLQINQLKWVTCSEIHEETNVTETLIKYTLVTMLEEHYLHAKDANGNFYDDSKVWYPDDILNDLEVQIRKHPPKRRRAKKKFSHMDLLPKPVPVPV